jgi:hypothetical protein
MLEYLVRAVYPIKFTGIGKTCFLSKKKEKKEKKVQPRQTGVNCITLDED